MARHRSSAVPLSWLYVGLIVYASLYPFTGWRVPGHPPLAFLTAPWWRWWTGFDVVSNLLGYLPLGALLFGALVRTGNRSGPASALTVAKHSATSASLIPFCLNCCSTSSRIARRVRARFLDEVASCSRSVRPIWASVRFWA